MNAPNSAGLGFDRFVKVKFGQGPEFWQRCNLIDAGFVNRMFKNQLPGMERDTAPTLIRRFGPERMG